MRQRKDDTLCNDEWNKQREGEKKKTRDKTRAKAKDDTMAEKTSFIFGEKKVWHIAELEKKAVR